MKSTATSKFSFFLIMLLLLTGAAAVSAQADNPAPPDQPVRLIFIHHSCGENLLSDDNGGLGLALAENNYFVSDTNYGWGPDNIGDRTDIVDWPEWFTGPDSGRYLQALYNEHGRNSRYTRLFDNPGGENEIIMFKSCFPNSNLEGSPDDPPQRGDGLTVGNAKAIYNELLTYFATRPDKLFIAFTAPPLQDGTYAHNARAFNTWLTTEWLQGYESGNVAVFDFYNVLTGEGNHHRFQDGRIEYITDQGGDTLAYPSGDDHPSAAGNHKLTAEFVPLLNVYYHRWQEGGTETELELELEEGETEIEEEEGETETETETEIEIEEKEGEVVVGGVIDDFEEGGEDWEAYSDEDSAISCTADTADSYSGDAGLHIEYDIAPDGWGDCTLEYDDPRDLSGMQGVVLYVRAGQAGQPVTIVGLQEGDSDEFLVFEYRTATTQEAVDGWQRLDISWEQLTEPEWQGSGETFAPDRVMGLALSFDADEEAANSGELWVDDVSFLAAGPPPFAPNPPVVTEPQDAPAETAVEPSPPPPNAAEDARPGLCPGSILMGITGMVAAVWVTTTGKRQKRPARKRPNVKTAAYLILSLLALLGVAYLLAGCAAAPPAATAAAPDNAPQTAVPSTTAPTGTVLLPVVTTPAALPADLLQPDDLTYLGAFRLPRDAPAEIGWQWSNWSSALTYYPDGDPGGGGDGLPGSLFGVGHDWNQYVSEISIPVPVNSAAKNLEELNTAVTLQPFADIRGGLFDGLEMPRVGLAYLPPQGSQTTGKLYFAWAPHLDEGATNPSHGWSELTLDAPQTAGAWRIGEYANYVTGDYLFDIPQAWADAYAAGASLATGRYRDGGQSAQGPALFTIAPWESGNPPAAGSTLSAAPLLLYQDVTVENGVTMDNYHHSDEWTGAAWLTAGDKTAVIFVGNKGTGDCWYGNQDGPCHECDDRGWWSTGFEAQIIFYDPADLAAVAQGTMASWGPQPYAVLNIDEHLYHVTSTQQKHHVAAAAFDRANGLLYVVEPLVDEEQSIIHVWQVE